MPHLESDDKTNIGQKRLIVDIGNKLFVAIIASSAFLSMGLALSKNPLNGDGYTMEKQLEPTVASISDDEALPITPATDPDAAKKAYEEKMRQIIDSQKNKNNQKPNKATVDIKQINSNNGVLTYKGTTFNKIGYNDDGTLMEPGQRKNQVITTYKKLKEKGNSWFITYPAKGEEKAGIFVFTDPTCPFCKKLHNSISELNAKGITVNYLMYPRTLPLGEDNPSAKLVLDKFKNAWCSKNPEETIDLIYSGLSAPKVTCDTNTGNGRGVFPVFEHFFFGQLFDIKGTPYIFSSNGSEKEGFSDTESLIQMALGE